MQPQRDSGANGPLSGPLRFLIRCRRSRFEQRGKSSLQLLEKLAKRQRLDPTKLVLLTTTKGARRVHIVADYDNPTHARCEVRSFKGNSLQDIRIPADAVDYLHGRIESHLRQMERFGGRFPVYSEIFPAGQLPARGGDDAQNKPDDEPGQPADPVTEEGGSDSDADHTSEQTAGEQLELGTGG